MSAQHIRNGGLISLRGGGCEGERNLAETQLEQAVAAPGLAVVVALRGCPGDDLDLTIVETETAVDARDLGLDGALVREEQPRWTALHDGGRDGARLDIGEGNGGGHGRRGLPAQAR